MAQCQPFCPCPRFVGIRRKAAISSSLSLQLISSMINGGINGMAGLDRPGPWCSGHPTPGGARRKLRRPGSPGIRLHCSVQGPNSSIFQKLPRGVSSSGWVEFHEFSPAYLTDRKTEVQKSQVICLGPGFRSLGYAWIPHSKLEPACHTKPVL